MCDERDSTVSDQASSLCNKLNCELRIKGGFTVSVTLGTEALTEIVMDVV